MEITLTINPRKLSNPDADLRYTIPDMIEKLSNNDIQDNGFDYDEEDNMLVFLSYDSLDNHKAINFVQLACENLKLESEAIKIEVSA